MGSGKRVWFAGMRGGREGGREVVPEAEEEEEEEAEEEAEVGFVFPSERGSGKKFYSTHKPAETPPAAAAAAGIEEEEGGFTFPSERGSGKRRYTLFSRPEGNYKRRR
eukprot:evm.model.NODE_24120_length_1218_cov_19.147783.1